LRLTPLPPPPVRIVPFHRHITNRRSTAVRFHLTLQKVPDLQKRSKSRFHFAGQPAIQRSLTRPNLLCDRRFAVIAQVDVFLQPINRTRCSFEIGFRLRKSFSPSMITVLTRRRLPWKTACQSLCCRRCLRSRFTDAGVSIPVPIFNPPASPHPLSHSQVEPGVPAECGALADDSDARAIPFR
jgi:hypothetical protein